MLPKIEIRQLFDLAAELETAVILKKLEERCAPCQSPTCYGCGVFPLPNQAERRHAQEVIATHVAHSQERRVAELVLKIINFEDELANLDRRGLGDSQAAYDLVAGINLLAREAMEIKKEA